MNDHASTKRMQKQKLRSYKMNVNVEKFNEAWVNDGSNYESIKKVTLFFGLWCRGFGFDFSGANWKIKRVLVTIKAQITYWNTINACYWVANSIMAN